MNTHHIVVIDNETQKVATYVAVGHSMDDYNAIGFINSIERRETQAVQVARAVSALQAWR